MAQKNKLPYIMVQKVFIGDFGTYIKNTGDGSWEIVAPNSRFEIDRSGNITISGSQSVTIGGDGLDFTELPDRYIRPSGVSWDWIRNNTEVFGALPIKIKGKKVYIPFIGMEV